MIYIVYKHTCIISGKSYIGYTCQGMIKRWNNEIIHSRNIKNKHKLDNALRKYPDQFWKHEILINDISKLKQIKKLEIEMIAKFDTFNNGYNSNPGGSGIGKHSKKTKEKISKTLKSKGIKRSEKQKKQHSIWMKQHHPLRGKKHKLKSIDQNRKSQKNRKPVIINGKYFDSIRQASKITGFDRPKIRKSTMK